MNRIFPYIIVFIFLLIFITILTKMNREYYDSYSNNRPPGPWGNIGTAKPWYEYPYILHNIEY